MIQRNLVTSLLLYESVRTTKKRADVAQPVIDHLVHIAKTRQPHVAIRAINKVVTDKNASRKIMEVLKERYRDRPSGLTRIVPAGARKGDGARIVDLTLLEGHAVPTAETSGASAAPKKKVKAPKALSSKKVVAKKKTASSPKK
ncbi:MAG: bL17 family ribosomal protein [Candidatus Peribacteraceae bacterium]|jgi:ribosomal protein L17